MNAILVPGGFGERGSEGKIAAVKFARERHVPFFGICLGMQMACIEGARNTAGVVGASSTEFGPTTEPVVGIITEWMSQEGIQKRETGGDMGGTMRLGAYDAVLDGNSHVASIYGSQEISERHRQPHHPKRDTLLSNKSVRTPAPAPPSRESRAPRAGAPLTACIRRTGTADRCTTALRPCPASRGTDR